ncbi:MAG: hypothetical protein HY618_00935 [Candidatus Tectomicrobia bacterium]|uniref:Uncharacterized protein n=1 Tax=Tectimicrobiota bacterium TaxID=2528274 RepID=A0A932ZT55_UNCTE|nr:hypothetical protein [Candidatus Tectomicrobia bacterium]
MALAAAIPKEVADAMARLGVQALAPGGRAYRIAGKVIHLATAEGRKRALDTGTGVEVDPRTERPLGERASEAAKGIGGPATGAVKQMIAEAVQAAAGPLAKKIADLEKALEGKADRK